MYICIFFWEASILFWFELFEFYLIHLYLSVIIVTEGLFCQDKFPGLMILCTIRVY